MTRSKPLWQTENHKVRLAELTAGSSDKSKDNPLRQDVRSLGTLLGEVLVDQAGEELFAIVERLRGLPIQNRSQVRRQSSAADAGKLLIEAQSLILDMDLAKAYHVTKAFAIYFELTNL